MCSLLGLNPARIHKVICSLKLNQMGLGGESNDSPGFVFTECVVNALYEFTERQGVLPVMMCFHVKNYAL